MPISLPHHLGGMTLHQPRFRVCLIFLELKCHVTPCIRMHALVRVGPKQTVLTPFRDGIWNRRQVSVGDRGGVLPTRPRNCRG